MGKIKWVSLVFPFLILSCAIGNETKYAVSVGFFPDYSNSNDEYDLCVHKYQSHGEMLYYVGTVDLGMITVNRTYNKSIALEPDISTIVFALRASSYDSNFGYYFSIVNIDSISNNEIEGFWWRGYKDESGKIHYALNSTRAQNISLGTTMEYDLSINPYYLLEIDNALGKSFSIEVERTDGNATVSLLKHYFNSNNGEPWDGLNSIDFISTFQRDNWSSDKMFVYIGSSSFDYNEKCKITISEY